MSVIKLETDEQEYGCSLINDLYTNATKGRSTRAKNFLKHLYGDLWEIIKERMETEGSVWYVWYMDGVNHLLNHHLLRSGTITWGEPIF
jgi:hypothetical protein